MIYYMSGLQFNNDSDFKRENITTTGNSDNVVILEGNSRNTNNLRSETRKPQFSNEQFDNAKRVKIKPNLNTFDFQSMANPKRSNDKSDDEVESNDEDIDLSDANSDEEMENIDMPNFADTNMEQNFNNEEIDRDEDSMEGDEVSSEDGISVEDDDDESVTGQEYMPEEPKVDTKKTDEFPDVAPKNYRETTKLKQELLYKLARLEKSGYELSRRLTMASSYDDLLFEYRRLKKQRDVESSVKFYRKILMLFVSGTEKLNNKFDPLNIKLDGWSENVMENVKDYDEVFEELHDKYSDSVSMMPELKLLLMVVGSGFMFHLTNSLFKTVEPDLGDLIRNNPDIARSISKDAMNKISEKLGTGDNDPLMNMMRTGVNMKNNASSRGNNRTFDVRRPPRTSAGQRPGSSSKDMESVDNILNSLENSTKPVQGNMQKGVRLNI